MPTAKQIEDSDIPSSIARANQVNTALSLHTQSTGNNSHIPSTGVTNTHIAADAQIDWAKVNKAGALPSDIGATANSTDAQLRNRATHTGTQPYTSVTGLGSAAILNTGVAAGQIPLLGAGNVLDPTLIPNIDASKVISGTLADARIPSTIARDTEVSGAILTHAAFTGKGNHIPSTGIANVDIADDAAVAWTKISKAGAIASDIGAAPIKIRQTFANSDAVIADSTTQIAQTDTLTAPRILSLPSADAVLPGSSIEIIDESGTASYANYINVAAAPGDTVNGVSQLRAVAASYGGATLISDGVSKWSVTTLKSFTDFGEIKNLYAINNYTLQLEDSNHVIQIDNASPITVIVPSGLRAGFNVLLVQGGAGSISIVGIDGVRVNGGTTTLSAVTKGAYQTVAVYSTDLNKYVLSALPVLVSGARQTFDNSNAIIAPTSTQIAQIGNLTATRTLALFPASSVPSGTKLTILDESGSASSTLKVILTASSGNTVNGGATFDALNAPYKGIHVVTDGNTKWTAF